LQNVTKVGSFRARLLNILRIRRGSSKIGSQSDVPAAPNTAGRRIYIMRLAIVPALAAVLLATPVQAQPDQKAVDALIGQLRPRPNAPIVQRGLPKPVAPVAQPSAVQPVSSSQAVTPPRPVTPAAVVTADTAGLPSANMNILFATGSAELTSAAVQQLRTLGMALTHESMGQSRFLIEGHTDTVGDSAMNQSLSDRRAATVASFLVREFRLPAERLTTRGVGEEQLLVPTADNTNEPRNRRVHIVNLDG
jgi:outer membrane protein OmpA-like peptidoglycan-associated protein